METTESSETPKPKHLRTWWHPVFAGLVRHWTAAGYQSNTEFTMQHAGTEQLVEVLERLVDYLPKEARLRGLSVEDRLAGLKPERRLAGLEPKQLFAGFSPEQRLAGLAPEERLAGMSRKTIEEYLKKLGNEGNGSSH